MCTNNLCVYRVFSTLQSIDICTQWWYNKDSKKHERKCGKTAPEGAIPCCEPDPVTGHHPHWVMVDENKSDDKWYVLAYHFTRQSGKLPDGTYEIIGKHFRGNPYNMEHDELVKHENLPSMQVERSFEGVREWLNKNNVEGLVFWLNGEPVCKIKRTDFGFEWNPNNPKGC